MQLVDLRLLTGPNIYTTYPVVKLAVDASQELAVVGAHTADARDRLAAMLQLPPGEPTDPEQVGARKALESWTARIVARLHERSSLPLPEVLVFGAHDPDEIVVVFGWDRAGAARALGGEVYRCLRAVATGGEWDLDAAVGAIASAPGEDETMAISDAERRVPMIAVTGTNGKTTVSRLCAHVLRTAGYTVGISGSDGVLVGEDLLEAGDMSGPSGARQALEDPRTQFVVAETARGGILLKGTGWQSCDVAVVTNVTHDHLGLQGVHTLEQLAWAKGLIVTLTGPQGVAVLNADDPVVAAMAARAAGRVVLCSLYAESVREHVERGGEAMFVRDWEIVRSREGEETVLLSLADAPLTLGGVARHNVSNVLCASAALLSAGVDVEHVRKGLRTFDNSPEHNPGRLNVFKMANGTAIVDYAHNEAGISALLDVAEHLATGRVVIVVGTAGDRTDETFIALGRIAAERADSIHMKGTIKYTRGRDPSKMRELMEGGIHTVADPPPHYWWETELEAAQHAVEELSPGDVAAIMCVEDKDEIGRMVRE